MYMQLPGQIGDVRQVMEVYGSVADGGTGHDGVAASGTAVCRNRWGYARRGTKTVTDKVDVGNNPRDGNVCWKYLSRGGQDANCEEKNAQ